MTVIKQYVGSEWETILIGKEGPPGIVTGPTPPTDTDLLWADTTTEGLIGIPGPPGTVEGLFYNVADYGAVGDGVTDDSAAFAAALDAAKAAIIVNSALFGTDRRGQARIVVPPGVYRIVTPEALLTGPGVRTNGIVFDGAGIDVTNIFFDPASPVSEVYLCRNLDLGWRSVRFRSMTFVADDANASFLYSESTGGPQFYRFDDVGWAGTWKRGIVLEGTNNNSESLWDQCYVGGTWQTFFDLSPSNTVGGDQFVTYDFYSPRIWMNVGNFVKATRGGNINIYGGSLIHANPALGAEQVFFELLGTSHSRGATRLQVQGARFELRHNLSKIIRCGWGDGNVVFANCDFSSQIATTTLASHISAEFNPITSAGPVVAWRDCRLHGRHRYTYNSNSFQYAQRVIYDGCSFQTAEVSDCILVNAQDGYGGTNLAGGPRIDLRNCRAGEAANNRYNLVDQRFGWRDRISGAPEIHYCQMIYANGLLPSNTLQAQGPIRLPLGAIITGLHGWKPAGTVNASTNFTYTFTNGDATVLGVINGDGTTPWTNGFEEHIRDLWIVCDTDNKRAITLTTANMTSQSVGHMLVEYLA